MELLTLDNDMVYASGLTKTFFSQISESYDAGIVDGADYVCLFDLSDPAVRVVAEKVVRDNDSKMPDWESMMGSGLTPGLTISYTREIAERVVKLFGVPFPWVDKAAWTASVPVLVFARGKVYPMAISRNPV